MALIPPVTRLTSSIIRILGCNPSPMTLQGTNTYLLGNGKKRILIDTGDENVPEYIEQLNGVLQQEKATIGTIILTHWHHDHVGGVKDIVGSTLADKVRLNADCQVFKFKRSDQTPDLCPEIPSHIQVQPLADSQEFAVDGAKVRIVHTPGHTTDHVVLTTDDGTLFSGDCILGEGTAVFEDLFDYMRSLDKILKIEPKRIFPGHGNVIEEPLGKIEYYIQHRNQREQQILQFFVERPCAPWQAMDVVKVVYKETPEHLWPAAAYNVDHHLSKLHKEGKLQLNSSDDDAKSYSYQANSAL
ncbi:beta-lactamase-like protein 2 homolog isoform X1 [Drosophila albomicans]|uniref:Beta-lactamase-like protein 2 homolog n=1 Tax=Drosophila albomicans TaxID=7291 RepID=A0A6P8WZV6_DROAB|nr:beta-lactamase-like protein 2 homolog isoform X1 [Drosophila albomicans]